MNGMTSQADSRARLTALGVEGGASTESTANETPPVTSHAPQVKQQETDSAAPPVRRRPAQRGELGGRTPRGFSNDALPRLHPQLRRRLLRLPGPGATDWVFRQQKRTLGLPRDQRWGAEVLAGCPPPRALGAVCPVPCGCWQRSVPLQSLCLPGRTAFPGGSLTRTLVMAFRARLGPFPE